MFLSAQRFIFVLTFLVIALCFHLTAQPALASAESCAQQNGFNPYTNERQLLDVKPSEYPQAFQTARSYAQTYGKSVDPVLLLTWIFAETAPPYNSYSYSNCDDYPQDDPRKYSLSTTCSPEEAWQLGYGVQFNDLYPYLETYVKDAYPTSADPDAPDSLSREMIQAIGQRVLNQAGQNLTFPNKTITELKNNPNDRYWLSVLLRDPAISMTALAYTFQQRSGTGGQKIKSYGSHYNTYFQDFSNIYYEVSEGMGGTCGAASAGYAGNDPGSTGGTAQANTGTPITSDTYKAPQNANYTMQNLFHAALCELAGMSPAGQCVSLVRQGNLTELKAFDRTPGGGVIGGMNGVMVAMYSNPPTSTSEYLADAVEGFGIIQPAHAQVIGSGAGIIEPVRLLWQVVRNIAYVGFTIIFVVTGFMIMLRRKLNPQTVITIQQALPGLVIGLILVTFSYFIAALLIDISFFTIQLSARVFTSAGLPSSFGNRQEIIGLAQDSNAFKLYWEPTKNSLGNIQQIGGAVLETIGSTTGANGDFNQRLTGFLATGGIAALIAMIIGGFAFLPALTGVAAGVGIVTLLIPLILIIAFVIQFFRLLFALIRAYITLLVMTVLGPFFIIISTLPGRSGVLTFWWKQILANALVFPAVFIAFLFVGMILALYPNVWRASPPLFGGLSTVILQIIIGYGIILGLPAIPNMVKESLGVKDLRGLPEAAIAGFQEGRQRVFGGVRRGYQQGARSSGLADYRAGWEKKRVEEGYLAASTGKGFWSGKVGKRIARWMP